MHLDIFSVMHKKLKEFFSSCHPWAELIRPHFAHRPEENRKEIREEDPEKHQEEPHEETQEENPGENEIDEPDHVVKKHVVTSSVVLGRRVNIVVDKNRLRFERDRQRDFIRYQSIELGIPNSK